MEKITLQKFQGLQGCSNFIKVATNFLFKEGETKTYDEWYVILSKQFQMGAKKTFPVAATYDAQDKTDNKIQTKK